VSEWWSYRPSDFLLFSARTYHRLFELYNAELWPAHLLALAIGLAVVYAALTGGAQAARVACLLLAACWLWVAWAFHLQRYAAINWAATGFAAAFAIEGGLLFLCGVFGARLHIRTQRGWSGNLGLGLLVFALFIQPWLGLLLFGRPWREAGLFGMAPDPTALATLGLLLLLRPLAPLAWLLWPIPLLWCLVGATIQWTLAGVMAISSASRSELVAELAQHLLARVDVGLGFDSLALDAIDNAENSSPAPRVGHDDLHRIGRRAVDGANLRHRFDRVEDIDRESAGHEDDEAMSATQRQGIFLRQLDEFRVVPAPTHQGGPA
jgi:hypothetical protein